MLQFLPGRKFLLPAPFFLFFFCSCRWGVYDSDKWRIAIARCLTKGMTRDMSIRLPLFAKSNVITTWRWRLSSTNSAAYSYERYFDAMPARATDGLFGSSTSPTELEIAAAALLCYSATLGDTYIAPLCLVKFAKRSLCLSLPLCFIRWE